MKVCAITGASGYVGSRLAQALARDFTVLPITRTGQNGIAFDLANPRDLTSNFRTHQVQTLVHAAWDMTQTKPAQYHRINVQGSRLLIESARAAGVQQIVFISTISAFPEARSLYGQAKVEVEALTLAHGGTAIRPGLIWGDSDAHPGGMFNSIRAQISSTSLIPTIGDGRYPQYLLHEDDLATAVLRAAHAEFPARTLTLAHPHPWLLRDLILHLAAQQHKPIKLVGIPWRFIHAALKTAETLGLKLNFRSDSVLSLVHQNPHPAFTPEIPVRPLL